MNGTAARATYGVTGLGTAAMTLASLPSYACALEDVTPLLEASKELLPELTHCQALATFGFAHATSAGITGLLCGLTGAMLIGGGLVVTAKGIQTIT